MNPPRSDRRHAEPRWLLWGGIAAYVLLFVLFFPRTCAIVDEDAYLTQAYLFRSGHLSYERSSIPAPHMTVEFSGRQVSKYPPGNALFLLPFTILGWRGVLVSGLVLALVGAVLFRATLRCLAPEADPAWSLFYLFYPAALLFSRTIMSDLLAATAVLAAFYCLLRRGWWLILGGLALGFACLVRYSNGVFVPVFVTLALIGKRPLGWRGRVVAVISLLAGLLPFAALIPAYNAYAFGGPLSFPMYLTGSFAPGYFPRNALYYGTGLMMLYPAMLIAPLAAGRGRWMVLTLPAYALVTLYCFFSYTLEVPDLAARLLVGMRYILPAAPYFVLGFVITLDRVLRRVRGLGWMKPAGILLLLLLGLAVNYRHDRLLATQVRYQRLMLENVPTDAVLLCDKDVSEILSYAWGWRDWRHISEFDVPVPTDTSTASRPLYAGLLERPGRERQVEIALMQTLIARYPGRSLVLRTAEPWRLELWRLR